MDELRLLVDLCTKADHDHEIAEARWVSFEEAVGLLAFKSERGVVEKAQDKVKQRGETHP